MTFKLTYATMFDPPEGLHTRYEAALEAIRANLGREYPDWWEDPERGLLAGVFLPTYHCCGHFPGT